MEQELIDKLNAMDAKLDTIIKQTVEKASGAKTFGAKTTEALETAAKKAAEEAAAALQAKVDALIAQYGGVEKLALEIKQREPGWPESIDNISMGSWSEGERAEVVAAFKAQHPDLFKETDKV